MFFNTLLRIKGLKERPCQHVMDAVKILEQRHPGHKIVSSVVAAWNVSHNFYLDEFGGELVGEMVYEAEKNWFNSLDSNGKVL